MQASTAAVVADGEVQLFGPRNGAGRAAVGSGDATRKFRKCNRSALSLFAASNRPSTLLPSASASRSLAPPEATAVPLMREPPAVYRLCILVTRNN